MTKLQSTETVLGTHTVLNERNVKIKAIKKKKYYKTGRKN